MWINLKKTSIVDKKFKNLWMIDQAVLNQMKYQKTATSRELSSLLDFPTDDNQPAMSRVLQRMKSSKLLKYNKQSKKYSLTELGKKVEKRIEFWSFNYFFLLILYLIFKYIWYLILSITNENK